MKTPKRFSLIGNFNEMQIAENVTGLEIANLSFIPRFGVKGVGAETWLATQSIAVPDRPNSWTFLSKRGIIARLGTSEFLIEDRTIAPQLTKACTFPPAKYPVLRQDLAIALIGLQVNELLPQTCSFNFQALSITENPVILTSMAGVNVTVIPGVLQEQPFYRIWCDCTFGAYLWQTLLN